MATANTWGRGRGRGGRGRGNTGSVPQVNPGRVGKGAASAQGWNVPGGAGLASTAGNGWGMGAPAWEGAGSTALASIAPASTAVDGWGNVEPCLGEGSSGHTPAGTAVDGWGNEGPVKTPEAHSRQALVVQEGEVPRVRYRTLAGLGGPQGALPGGMSVAHQSRSSGPQWASTGGTPRAPAWGLPVACGRRLPALSGEAQELRRRQMPGPPWGTVHQQADQMQGIRVGGTGSGQSNASQNSAVIRGRGAGDIPGKPEGPRLGWRHTKGRIFYVL